MYSNNQISVHLSEQISFYILTYTWYKKSVRNKCKLVNAAVYLENKNYV